MNDKIYIHYGSNSLNLDYDYSDYEIRKDKPTGLWASPENSPCSWCEWCKSEDYLVDRLRKQFKFIIKPDSKILKVSTPDFLPDKYIKNGTYREALNLDAIYSDYDGMEIFYHNNTLAFQNSPIFWSWDCDSIVIWNLNIIQPIERSINI